MTTSAREIIFRSLSAMTSFSDVVAFLSFCSKCSTFFRRCAAA